MPGRSNRTAKLNLRLSPEDKEKLQAAASESRRSVSEFVLESSALVRAEKTLTDRTRFSLEDAVAAAQEAGRKYISVASYVLAGEK